MSKRTQFWRKVVASTVAYTLALGQIAPTAYAAATDISEVPLAVKNQVAPNIMMTLDDSGSMQWEFLPDEEMRWSMFMYPRPNNPYGGSTYNNQVPNFNDNNVHNFYGRSSNNNKSYYNPDTTYRPWSNPDGTLWPTANPRAALYNPAIPGVGSIDLISQRTDNADWFSDGNTGSLNQVSCDPGCSANHTYWPLTYFVYRGSGSLTSRGRYDIVEIKSTTPASRTYNYTIFNADGTTSVGTRTRDEEIQNFANWFQYTRSRISLARAGIGRAFSTLGETPRVGFAAINEPSQTIDGVSSPGTVLTGVRAFTGADRTTFFNTLYNLQISANGTPLRRAMDDIGQYFSRTDNRGPWGANPGSVVGTQLSCRQNFHILMTDGYWNDGTAPARAAARRANVDNTIGPTHTGTRDGLPATDGYTPPANPFRDNWSDTLADVAMYYWVNDLRPLMPNNVFTNATDNAFWQHVTTFGVALGVFGTIPPPTIQAAFTTPYPTINWPNPTLNGSTFTRIDDLAHAGVNTRGGFFSASNPDELATSLAQALDNISSRLAAGAAVGITSANVISGDNMLFASSFQAGFSWSGELKALPIDVNTGIPSTTPTWTAQTQLNARTPGSRVIATYDPGASVGRPFQAASLTAGQLASLNTPPGLPADAANVVPYLRGDRTGETSGTYRRRVNLLGDIVGAQPVVVRPPQSAYTDLGYAAFRTSKATRAQTVLQGANDGMLHAFDAGTAPVGVTAGTPGTGAEKWAYIPSFVIPNLNNLSRRVGYQKKNYVNAPPVVGDLDFNRTGGSIPILTDWRTIAVGGLGSGGRGFYALDLTDDPITTEAQLAGKVLWEFPSAGNATHAAVRANVGLSFGKPIITKTKARGWVVIVTSGYNNGTNTAPDPNGDGRGYIFVLNAKTGDLIRAISTGVGTAADPSGLAHISGYAENGDLDNTVEYVYGGDLQGNVSRFDLTHATDPTQWSVTKLAALVDAGGNPQPVSSVPELSKVRGSDGVDRRFVYIGTGLLLGDSDLPGAPSPNAFANQTQTVYGLVDDLSAPLAPNPVINPLRTNLVQQTLTDTGDGTGNRRASGNAVDLTTRKGWFVDLPTAGERINTALALGLGALVFSSNVPSSDLCILGGTSYINFLDYRTGGLYAQGTSPPLASIKIAQGLLSAPVLISVSGKVGALTQDSTGVVRFTTTTPLGSGGVTKRRSWRELLQ